jgi:hypothetical protein
LRADAAVDADDGGAGLDERAHRQRGGVAVQRLPVGAERHLRDDRNVGRDALDRTQRREHFVQILKRLDDERVATTFEQALRGHAERRFGLGRRDRSERFQRLPQGPHRSRHDGVDAGDLTRGSGDARALPSDDAGLLLEPMRGEPYGVGAERVRLDELGARGEVFTVDRLDQPRLGEVERIETLIEPDAMREQHGPHRSVGEQGTPGETLQQWGNHGRVLYGHPTSGSSRGG